MKKRFYFLLISLLPLTFIDAQVSSGNVSLFSQAQVNAFNYTEVTGHLTINGSSRYNGGDPITDLSPLAKLIKVGRDLSIMFTDVTDLNALQNLESVGRKFGVNANDKITNITVPKLESVGMFEIGSSSSGTLKEINFPQLTTVNGLFQIVSNPSLTVANFPKLDAVFGNLTIQGNPLISNLDGFSALTNVGGNLGVSTNSSLNDCCVFINLLNTPGAVAGNAYFYDNKKDCNNKNEILSSCANETVSGTVQCSNISNKERVRADNHIFSPNSFGQSFVTESSCYSGSQFSAFSFWAQGNSLARVDVKIYKGTDLTTAPQYSQTKTILPPANFGGKLTVELKDGDGSLSFNKDETYTILLTVTGGNLIAHVSNEATQGQAYLKTGFVSDKDLLFEIATR